jgi:hypothetical protein
VSAFVLGHVDLLDGRGRSGERATPNGIGVAEHRRVEPVVVGIGLGVDDTSTGTCSASTIASITSVRRPSLKFGTTP